jgi:hypothetical protein
MLPYVLDWLEPASSPVKASHPGTLEPASRNSPSIAANGATTRERAGRFRKDDSATTSADPPAADRHSTRAGEGSASAPRCKHGNRRSTPTSRRGGVETHWKLLGTTRCLQGFGKRRAAGQEGEGRRLLGASGERHAERRRRARSGRHGYGPLCRARWAFADRTRAIAARDDLQARGHAAFVSEGTAQ